MKLQEIFDQLSHAEFSQLNLGGGDMPSINPQNMPRVASAINTGLAALHTRFFLREERLTLQLMPGRYSYPLRMQYAQSARSTEPDRYILDSEESPFRDNLMKVEQVFTETRHEMGLNDKDDPFSVMTPSMNVLTVPRAIVEREANLPECLKTNTLTVVYRANHPVLTEDFGLDDPEEAEIDLPYSHLQALCYYVASRLHNPSGMIQHFHLGNNYHARYEAECQRLEHHNIQIDQTTTNTRLERNGWV